MLPMFRSSRKGIRIRGIALIYTAAKLFYNMILIEFKKAFDSVHRNYLVATLVDLDVPQYLIQAIISLYWPRPLRSSLLTA